jgi:hypothetical protein
LTNKKAYDIIKISRGKEKNKKMRIITVGELKNKLKNMKDYLEIYIASTDDDEGHSIIDVEETGCAYFLIYNDKDDMR